MDHDIFVDFCKLIILITADIGNIFSLPVIPENEKISDSNELEDINQTKIKLRELMLMEKVSQLEKQLSQFTTLPVTHDYETIQLNSCNIDDLVIAVYNEDYGSYKIIHKSSNYLHFVHSAIFKSHEQRLSFKVSVGLLCLSLVYHKIIL